MPTSKFSIRVIVIEQVPVNKYFGNKSSVYKRVDGNRIYISFHLLQCPKQIQASFCFKH